MRCLTYAVRKFIQDGGYIAIRRCRVFKYLWLPHFLHAEKLEGVTHMGGKTPPGKWWQELWWTFTGQNYIMKYKDD